MPRMELSSLSRAGDRFAFPGTPMRGHGTVLPHVPSPPLLSRNPLGRLADCGDAVPPEEWVCSPGRGCQGVVVNLSSLPRRPLPARPSVNGPHSLLCALRRLMPAPPPGGWAFQRPVSSPCARPACRQFQSGSSLPAGLGLLRALLTKFRPAARHPHPPCAHAGCAGRGGVRFASCRACALHGSTGGRQVSPEVAGGSS